MPILMLSLKLRKNLRKNSMLIKLLNGIKMLKVNYGYHNFLFTQIDDIEGNLPFKTDIL